MAAFGASCPFPWVLANVPSPNPQQPFAAGNGTAAPRLALIDLLPGKLTYSAKPPQGKLDGGEGDEGGQGFREVLKVLGCVRTRRRCVPPTQRRGKMTKPFMSPRPASRDPPPRVGGA